MKERKIHIKYSWGEEEEPIRCSPERAWNKMVELAMDEARTVMCDSDDHEVLIHFFPQDMYIMLCYMYDRTVAYYTYE